MGQSEKKSSRQIIAEFITTQRPLLPHEKSLLQSALSELGLYDGKLDGDLQGKSGEAIASFLERPENQNLIPHVNDMARMAVAYHAADERMGKGQIQKIWESLPFTNVSEDSQEKLWGKNHTSEYNKSSGAKSIDHYLENGAHTKPDMENFQRALGMKKSDIDGEMGAKTIAAVTAYLKEEPNKFMSLGPQVLRTLIAMQSNDDYAGKTTDFKNLALNMPQYFARIDDLVAEIDKTGGLKDDPNAPPSAAAYTLQMMLKAGGLLDATPTGVIGKETLAAIEKSETAKETMIRQQGTREVDASATETAKPVAEPTIR